MPAPAVTAQAYLHVALPLSTAPLASDEEGILTAAREKIGSAGIEDADVVRIMRSDDSLAGYLLVFVVGQAAADDPDAAWLGVMDELKSRQVQPDVRTILGHRVAVFQDKESWEATRFDGRYFAFAIADSEDATTTIAFRVIEAGRP